MDGYMHGQTRTMLVGKSLSTSRALCWKVHSCEKACSTERMSKQMTTSNSNTHCHSELTSTFPKQNGKYNSYTFNLEILVREG